MARRVQRARQPLLQNLHLAHQLLLHAQRFSACQVLFALLQHGQQSRFVAAVLITLRLQRIATRPFTHHAQLLASALALQRGNLVQHLLRQPLAARRITVGRRELRRIVLQLLQIVSQSRAFAAKQLRVKARLTAATVRLLRNLLAQRVNHCVQTLLGGQLRHHFDSVCVNVALL